MTDAGGAPLKVETVAANQHDATTLLPLIVELPKVGSKPGRPQKPAKLIADKGVDCPPPRNLLRWLGMEPEISRRGDSEHGLGKSRWFVERTLSRLHQFRRLRIRWDRRPEIHQASCPSPPPSSVTESGATKVSSVLSL